MVCRSAEKFIGALLLVLVLEGCALQPKNLAQDFALSEASETGVVIGSVTYTGGYSGYSVLFKSNDRDQPLKVQTGAGATILPAWPKGDFGDIGMKGDLFAFEQPAGTYTFYSWNVSSGAAHINATAPFGISFVVKPGQAVYVGNFNFEQTRSMVSR